MNGGIVKAFGAKTNTWQMYIKGMSSNPDTLKWQHINASIMFTSDKGGETLSIYDPTTRKQAVIPFQDVERLITFVRDKKEGGRAE